YPGRTTKKGSDLRWWLDLYLLRRSELGCGHAATAAAMNRRLLGENEILLERGLVVRVEKPELLVVEGFAGRVGEDGPGVDDEAEGLVGEGESVPLGVEVEDEAPVLVGDEVGVAALRRREAEDRVEIGLVVPDPAVPGEERVYHGEDFVGEGERGVGVASARGEGTAA
ncbi:translation initiation factor IF-2, partial [Striga asiatica]